MLECALLVFFLIRKFGLDFKDASYAWLNTFLEKKELEHGHVKWTILLSMLLILAAIAFARIDTRPAFLGAHYVRLASDPFAFDGTNPVSYRLLTPFLSWLAGFEGRGLIVFNLLLSCLFVGTVYSYYRSISQQAGDALLAVLIATFSLVVLTCIYCGGYCDIMTYLLIFLMWQYRTKRLLFYGLFLLGLLNRESIVFLIPWFIFISSEIDGSVIRKIFDALIGLSITLGLYLLFRMWIGSHQEVLYSTSYYLHDFFKNPTKMFRSTFAFHSLGFFSVFKLMWIVPALAVTSWVMSRNYRQLTGMALLILGAYIQLFIAFDTSRMLTLSFMAMFISLNHLLVNDTFQLRSWIFWILLLNIVIPQPYTASTKIEIWQSLSTFVLSQVWK